MSDGILYHGDCLDVLRAFPDACVDLIYLDPPFNSNRDFFGRDGQVAFRDRWRWDEQARREAASLEKTLSGTHGEALMPALRSLLGESGMTAYLVMMANRLAELRRVLKSTGSLYLHCDPTASHYLKAVLDAIFGGRNFRNEIIWKRSVSKNLARRNFAASHDVLFRYAKTKGARFTAQHIPHDPEYARKRFGYRDADGRRYRLDDLTNPARNRPNLTYEFLGVTRTWRWKRERMMKAWEDGRIVLSSPGAVPRYKVWLEDLVVNATLEMLQDDKTIDAIVAMVMHLQEQENTVLPLLEKQLKEVASGIQIPMHGNVLMTIANEDKQEALQLAKRFANIGYGIYATKGTADLFEKEGLYVHRASKIEEGEKNNVVDIIRNGRVNFVINTMSSKENTRADGFLIRRVSAENNISCMTSLDTANALIKVLESLSFSAISMNEMGK